MTAMARRVLSLCVLWVLLWARPAAAQLVLGAADARLDLGTAVGVLADPGATLDLAGARAALARGAFRPSAAGRDELNFGYTDAAFWLYVELERGPDAGGEWLIDVGFPTLDRVSLFVLRAHGVERQDSGDLLPFAQRPQPHRNLLFALRLAEGERVGVLLRVESAGSLTVPLTLWSPAALQRHDQFAYAGNALYFGMLLALLLYNLLLWLSLGDGVFIRYVAFVAAIAVGFLAQSGFGAQFLWPAWPQWSHYSFPVGMAATGLFGALFTRSMLVTHLVEPRLDRLILVFAWVFAAAIAAHGVVGYRNAAMLTSVGGLCFAPVALWAGVRCAARGQAGARTFLLAWALLLIGVAVMALRNFSVVPTNWLTTHVMQIGSALEMLLLSFAMAERINVLRREREEARQALVESLRESELRLEARVTERTAELEAANHRLREQEQALQQLAFHDPLTGLFNRVMLEQRLQHAMIRADRGDARLAVLLIDLDGFKAVNDRHGHAAGDRVLALAAQHLQGVLRASDTLARLGGDEFVIVLEPYPGEAEAERVADKVIAALAALRVDGDCRIGGSVGIALYPRDGRSGDALIRAADRAMYLAKGAGKGRWRHAGAAEPAARLAG